MDASSDTLTVILSKNHDGEWKRKFSEDIKDSKYGKALDQLRNGYWDDVEKAFEGIQDKDDLSKILTPGSEYFEQEQEMAWYLDLIADHLFHHPRGKYEMRVKSCDQHLYVRLFNFDTKKLVLAPFFYSSKHAENKSRAEANRGFADIMLLVAPKLHELLEILKASVPTEKDKGKNELDIRDLFYWSEITLTGEVRDNRDNPDNGPLKIAIKGDAELFAKSLDAKKKVITIQLPTKEKEDEILVASENTRKALFELSEVWHNKNARSVLLCAATGSGKEVLKDMLLYSSSVDDVSIVQEAAPVIASTEAPLSVLLQELDKNKLIDGDKIRTPAILFLDEIHHPQVKKLRTILLRCMEDEKLHVPGDRTIEAKGLLYVFAASKPRAHLRDLPPPDFWTRIEHNIVMKHALLGLKRPQKEDVLQHFFGYFWRKVSSKWPHSSPYIKDELTKYENLEALAKKFAEELSSTLIPPVSIRIIRSLVYRLYSKAVYFAGTEQVARNRLAEEIRKRLDDWIAEIWEDIVPEAKTEMF